MVRITWEMDGEYQQRSVYTFKNAPVSYPSNVFSQNHNLVFGVFGPIST